MTKKINSLIVVMLSMAVPSVPIGCLAQGAIDASSLYEKLKPSACVLLSLDANGNEIGSGSGIVVTNDGNVMTNRHVIDGAARVNLECGGKRGSVKTVKAHKKDIDLVVLDTTLTNSVPIEIGDVKAVKPGSVLFVIGNPFGLNGTITAGLSSGIRAIEGVDYLQLSAQINAGNSGGMVVNQGGQLIAIATMKLNQTEGIGFAIPAYYASELATSNLRLGDMPPIGSTALEQERTLPASSTFSFRNIPFGTKCRQLEAQIQKSVLPIHWDQTIWLDGIPQPLMGEEAQIIYRCRIGYFVEAEYHLSNTGGAEYFLRIKDVLGQKYGEPTVSAAKRLTNGIRYHWETVDGGAIDMEMSSRTTAFMTNSPDKFLPDGAIVIYSDTKLIEMTKKIETLKAFRENDL